MDINKNKCKCQCSITNEQNNEKSSKTVQTVSIDSDIFYDFPDENDSAIPTSSNRSRTTTTTQNDRNRDHSNLSHEPNIEAPAGPRQQPLSAGQRQTYQAKDKMNNENEDEDGNKINKENVSQDEEFINLSSEAKSSRVKLSFSTANACEDLQGSYECFCGEDEEEEKGSCHKFWCQHFENLGNIKQIVEDSVRVYESQKKSIERRKEDNETKIADQIVCGSQKTMICDYNTKPDIKCCCVLKSSCKEIQSRELKGFSKTSPISSEREDHVSSNVLNTSQQKSVSTKSRGVNKLNDSPNGTEDLCSFEEFENSPRSRTDLSGRLYMRESEGKYTRRPNLDEPIYSVGTGITQRQTVMDENVIPLLKGIFDVLQTMREEKLHLGPISSRNIDLHHDEPFNGLPPAAAPPSSLNDFQGVSSDTHQFKSTRNYFAFEGETDINFINSEDNLELPERDFEETLPTSQRLIPVDMNLLRTDEELIWEPGSNFDKPEVENEEEEMKLKQFQGNTDDLNILHNADENDEATSSQLSGLKQSTSMEVAISCKYICEDPENGAEDSSRKSSNIKSYSNDQIVTQAPTQKLEFDKNDENVQKLLKIGETSQAVQVNLVELENLASQSAQFLILDGQLDLSNEKLLKASEISKSSKLDVGTDCPNFNNDCGNNYPDFDNDDGSSTNSQEPINQPQNQEMRQFIDSILFDLKAIDSFRKNSSTCQNFSRLPCLPTGGWQRPSRDLSYPVTIETVQELGANSLFVKWRVQNFGNIGGYEIFLDGHLTNRYFNCIHRAAVICDVDLHSPHRIILRAQPLLHLRTLQQTTDSSCSSSKNTKCPSNNTATTPHPEASCPQPDGSVWYPSVYHFEPNSLSAPINAVLY